MTHLAVRLFGTEILATGAGMRIAAPAIWGPIIGCLVASPRHSMTRSRLASELWGDKTDDGARRCLATALWRLRTQAEGGRDLIAIDGERLTLLATRWRWIDVLAFEHRIAAVLADPSRLSLAGERARLRYALRLYRGDFLPDRGGELIAIERERLRALYLDALHELALAEARIGEWEDAQRTARILCAAEPLREDAQRLLIDALARCAGRGPALQQYRAFKRLLFDELGVAPMPETVALVTRLAERSMPSPDAALDPDPARSQGPAPLQDGKVRAVLETARSQLAATILLIDDALAS